MKSTQKLIIAATFAGIFGVANAQLSSPSVLLAQADTEKATAQAGNTANNPGSSSKAGASVESTSGSSTGTTGRAGSSGKGQTSATANTAKGKGGANPPVYLLVPVDIASNDNSMKNGCWAKVYSLENYIGDSLTIVGPTNIADMDTNGLFGLNWDDRVNSVELGPKATMVVFDNENFADPVTTFKPGARVADISKRTGMFDEFASVKLDCAKA